MLEFVAHTACCVPCLLLVGLPTVPCACTGARSSSRQPAETSELLERLEDSLMALGGMATNRYAAPFRAEVQSWIRCVPAT